MNSQPVLGGGGSERQLRLIAALLMHGVLWLAVLIPTPLHMDLDYTVQPELMVWKVPVPPYMIRA